MYIFDVENKKQEKSTKQLEYEKAQTKKKSENEFMMPYLSEEFLRDEYPKAERLSVEAKRGIASRAKEIGGWEKWQKENPSIAKIATIGDTWYLCRFEKQTT